jgi:hypothetical protein
VFPLVILLPIKFPESAESVSDHVPVCGDLVIFALFKRRESVVCKSKAGDGKKSAEIGQDIKG